MVKNVKKDVAESILIAIFAAVTMGFFIPLDFYLANINELLLPLKYVGAAIAVTSVLIFAGVFLLDRLTSGRSQSAVQIINTLIFAIAFGFYIQGNFLSVGLGEMNGSKYSPGALRVIINILFWGVLLTGIVIFNRKKSDIYRKAVPYAATVITVIQIITASVSYVQMYIYSIDGELLGNWINDKDTFVCSMSGLDTYSANENFIIILADEYDSFVFDSAAEQCPEALEEFDGFTYYRNTVGMYGNTIEAVAYIFTGSKNDVPDPYSHDDFFDNLSKRYKVCLYAGPSHIFHKKIYENYAVNYFPSDFSVGDMMRTQAALLKATMFKCSPEILKGAFWFSNDDFSSIIGGTEDMRPYMPDDITFYNNIPQKANLTDENCFKLIYIHGLHSPRNVTAELQRAKHWSISAEEQAVAVNKIVNKYLEYLKKSGVYDNSTIIFMADHGLKNSAGGRYPLLMYKPANAEGKGITISDAPISHDDLYPTLIALSGGTPDGRTIFEIDENEQRERYFSTDINPIAENIK